MKDYSECIINIREFVRRAEDAFNAKNIKGAQHHVMNLVNEAQDLLDYAIEHGKEV
jgi:hypothetical protein